MYVCIKNENFTTNRIINIDKKIIMTNFFWLLKIPNLNLITHDKYFICVGIPVDANRENHGIYTRW